MDPIANNYLLVNLPEDIQDIIVRKLNINDLNKCLQVSKLWNKLFSQDVVWKNIKENYGLEMTPTEHTLRQAQGKPYIGWIFRSLNHLISIDNKSLVCSYVLRQDEEVARHFPDWIVKSLGGVDFVRRIPLKIFEQNSRVEEKDFTAPIVLGIYKQVKYSDECESIFQNKSCILLRIRDNQMQKVFNDGLLFSFDAIHPKHLYIQEREIGETLLDEAVLLLPREDPLECFQADKPHDRIIRLMKKQPIGRLLRTETNSNAFIEGPRLTLNGKSVLELC